MDSHNVIEITSSPEPNSPRKTSKMPVLRPRARNTLKRPLALPEGEVVIELTDSDSEEQGASQKKKPKVASKNEPEAGPSRIRAPKAHHVPASKAKPGSVANKPLARQATLNSDATLVQLVEKENLPRIQPPEPQPENNIPPNENQVNIARVAPEPLPPTEPVVPPTIVDPIDAYVAQVLEIIPDVEPDHLLALIEKYLPTSQDDIVPTVLHVLFEDQTYPKVSQKGKRKRDENEDEAEDRGGLGSKVDYLSKDRKFEGSNEYIDIAMDQLLMDFPFIPVPHVRTVFFKNNGLYAPAYTFLAEEMESGNLPYTKKTMPSRTKGKGKAKQNAAFEAERLWLLQYLQSQAEKKEAAAVAEPEDENDPDDDGIECGCCFANYAFDQMIQCPEAHLFCNSCMTSYASGLLGEHNPNIVCMDQTGCKLAFPVSELRRFLTPKLLELYDRVKQTKEIEAAGLENLEHCPFCEYKVVIDNPDEKLFRCENRECAAVSCRGCKKLDHLPKSCKEMEDDRHLDGRHAIEEAMTRALMRNCPKCDKAFIKEAGCNKMTCPNCGTMSCYICRKIIEGYEHFDQGPANPQRQSKRCILWDTVEKRHADEVTAAAKKALEDYKREHPDVDDKDIHVDLPPPQPTPPANPNAAVNAGAFVQNLAAMGQQAYQHALQHVAAIAQPQIYHHPQPPPRQRVAVANNRGRRQWR